MVVVWSVVSEDLLRVSWLISFFFGFVFGYALTLAMREIRTGGRVCFGYLGLLLALLLSSSDGLHLFPFPVCCQWSAGSWIATVLCSRYCVYVYLMLQMYGYIKHLFTICSSSAVRVCLLVLLSSYGRGAYRSSCGPSPSPLTLEFSSSFLPLRDGAHQ